jgi:anti-sigma regulatory factor (Ser/Thr protein kinase)
MSEWFRGFAAEAGVLPARALDFELCLNELVTNINHYAHADARGHEFQITLEAEEQELRATIEDEGRPFNPIEAEPPVRPESLASARIGGWGIPIVRALVDELRYERYGGRNRLTIVLRDARTPRAERTDS